MSVSSLGNIDIIVSHTHPWVRALAYFDFKKIYILRKQNLVFFSSLCFENFLVRTLQCTEALDLCFFPVWSCEY